MTRSVNTLILTFAVAIGLVSLATADVVHSTDFEADGAAQGTGFGAGFTPGSMNFTDAGGDLIGFTSNNNPETSGLALGLGNSNPASGSYHYVVDAGQTSDMGPGWGGSWSGISTSDALTSGGFTTQANATANGGNYVDFTGASNGGMLPTFTVSAGIATDSADALSGGANGAVRLEFYYDIDTDGDGVGDYATEIRSHRERVSGNGYDASTIMTTYQASTATHTLSAGDVDFANIAAPNAGESVVGFNRVTAVMGTDGHTNGQTDGLILYDDFLFEVNSENVVNVVPEPGSISLLLAGFLSLCGLVRRKRN